MSRVRRVRGAAGVRIMGKLVLDPDAIGVAEAAAAREPERVTGISCFLCVDKMKAVKKSKN